MTTAKNDVFIGLYLENFYLVGELTFGGEGIKVWWGGILLGIFLGGGMSEFLACGGRLHPSPSKENPDGLACPFL